MIYGNTFGADPNAAGTIPTNVVAEVVAGGKRFQVTGHIDDVQWTPGERGGAVIDDIPSSLDEYRAVREVLGHYPQGAALLQFVAFEMTRRNPEEGYAAITLNNTPLNARSTIERLKEVVVRNDPYYARSYLGMTFFDGACPENGYTPSRPLRVNIRSSVNTRYQPSQLLGGTVLYLDAYSRGYDTPWRGLQVVRDAAGLYVVSNCPACYTQCKPSL